MTTPAPFNFDDSASVGEVQQNYNKKYNIDLKKTDKYNFFDLLDTNNKFVIEVKHRNIFSYTYKSSMISENKFIKAKDYNSKGYNIYFVIKFKDGLFEYEYNIEDKHQINDIPGHQNGRNYVFIDMKKFIKV
jgi:hypothetical protein